MAAGLPAALAAEPDPRARRGIRHRLPIVVTAAICAVVAGYRSYTATAEWVADLPAETAVLLGIETNRLPSEAMIRRLLQAIDPDLLAAAIGTWLAAQIPTPTPGHRRAVAVDGKTLRGSRTRHSPARHVLAAADHDTGVVLASTDVDTKTNEITRFTTLLQHLSDLRGQVVTADALHTHREHVAYLAGRGAHWILTVKGNQPNLYPGGPATSSSTSGQHDPHAQPAPASGQWSAVRPAVRIDAPLGGVHSCNTFAVVGSVASLGAAATSTSRQGAPGGLPKVTMLGGGEAVQWPGEVASAWGHSWGETLTTLIRGDNSSALRNTVSPGRQR